MKIVENGRVPLHSDTRSKHMFAESMGSEVTINTKPIFSIRRSKSVRIFSPISIKINRSIKPSLNHLVTKIGNSE